MSKFKKFFAVAIMAIIAITSTSVGTANAASGWQTIGYDPNVAISGSYYKLSTMTSGGGDYEVIITSNRTGGKISVELYVDGKKFGTTRTATSGEMIFRGIGSGTKKVYAKAKTSGHTDFVSFQYRD